MAKRYGLAIRAVDAGDVDGVAQLLRAAGVDIPRDKLALRLEAVRTQPGVVLIAEEWGPPTGLIALTWSARLVSDLKAAEVTSLLVDPERRRSGVARLLLKAASQAARVAACGELVLNFETRTMTSPPSPWPPGSPPLDIVSPARCASRAEARQLRKLPQLRFADIHGGDGAPCDDHLRSPAP